MPQPSPAVTFLMELSSTYIDFHRKIDASLSVHGLSFTEWMVMHQLWAARHQTMSRIELANAIGLSASGITRLLNPMEKIHLVEKEKNRRDARVSLVKLTTAGQTVYMDALNTCTQRAETLTESVTTKQLSSLLALLGKLN